MKVLLQHPQAAELVTNAANSNGDTPLLFAASSGHMGIAAALLAAGADPCQANASGLTPVLAAAGAGHQLLLSLLLKATAQSTALAGSCPSTAADGTMPTAEAGLQAAALLQACDKHGSTALHFACRAGHEQVVRLLLHQGCDMFRPNAAGRSPLQEAEAAGHAGVLGLLRGRVSVLEVAAAARQQELCSDLPPGSSSVSSRAGSSQRQQPVSKRASQSSNVQHKQRSKQQQEGEEDQQQDQQQQGQHVSAGHAFGEPGAVPQASSSSAAALGPGSEQALPAATAVQGDSAAPAGVAGTALPAAAPASSAAAGPPGRVGAAAWQQVPSTKRKPQQKQPAATAAADGVVPARHSGNAGSAGKMSARSSSPAAQPGPGQGLSKPAAAALHSIPASNQSGRGPQAGSTGMGSTSAGAQALPVPAQYRAVVQQANRAPPGRPAQQPALQPGGSAQAGQASHPQQHATQKQALQQAQAQAAAEQAAAPSLDADQLQQVMHQRWPAAAALELGPGHLLGTQLQQLSAAQLDALEAAHQAQLAAIAEARLQLARRQERDLQLQQLALALEVQGIVASRQQQRQ